MTRREDLEKAEADGGMRVEGGGPAVGMYRVQDVYALRLFAGLLVETAVECAVSKQLQRRGFASNDEMEKHAAAVKRIAEDVVDRLWDSAKKRAGE